MNRGEVWWVRFDTTQGGEIPKQRPSIIVSNDVSNAHLNRVQVVPLTSKTHKLYPSEAYVTVKGKRHKAMADQLTTVGKSRLVDYSDRISVDEMHDVERVIRVQLSLS
jgi:mRNA interferase MazF